MEQTMVTTARERTRIRTLSVVWFIIMEYEPHVMMGRCWQCSDI